MRFDDEGDVGVPGLSPARGEDYGAMCLQASSIRVKPRARGGLLFQTPPQN